MLLLGVLCGWQDRWTDTPHRSSCCSGGCQAGTTLCPMAFGVVGAPSRCARQHLDGNLGWGCSQDTSHRGNSHVKKGPNRSKLGAGACLLARPCCSPASLSLGIPSKYIYIYKIKIWFLYIYIYISVLSLHGYLSPSIPTEARSPCPAPLVSSCGEAFLSVPSPRGPPKNPLGLPKTPLGPPQKPSGPSPNPSGASPTLQAPLQTLWTLCILMTVSCDVLTSLVYSDFPKPLI